MQGFESESFSIGGDHSQKVKAPPIENDYGSKDCVNLPSSTAVSRLKEIPAFSPKIGAIIESELLPRFYLSFCKE
jgi:hypothetical protein